MVVDDASRRVVGQLVPPGDFTVRLAVADDLLEVATDRLGRFTFDAVAPGPVRISIVDPDATHVVSTEWIML